MRKDTNLILNELIQGATFSVRQDSNALINLLYDGEASLSVVVDGLDTSAIGDFNIGTPSNGDVLVYNSTSGKWENKNSLSIITGQTTDDLATVIGTISLINNTIYNLSIKGIGVGAVSSPAEYASYTGTPPGCTTPITITADNVGIDGNNITLSFDGSKTITQIIEGWNIAYSTFTCTLDGDGTQIVNNKAKITLSGGSNEARSYAAINVVGSVKNEEGVVNINGVVVSSLFDDYTDCVLTIQAGTGSNLNILATGKAATAINWSAKVEWNDISFA